MSGDLSALQLQHPNLSFVGSQPDPLLRLQAAFRCCQSINYERSATGRGGGLRRRNSCHHSSSPAAFSRRRLLTSLLVIHRTITASRFDQASRRLQRRPFATPPAGRSQPGDAPALRAGSGATDNGGLPVAAERSSQLISSQQG